MKRLLAFVALAGALTVSACEGFGQAMTSHTDVLARAGGHDFSVDQATSILAPAERVPAQAEVVDAIANLWVDYTLLGRAAADDSTFQQLDLDAIITPYFNQQLVFLLRDSVINPDTVFTEDELRRLFGQRQPNAEVRARHILFRMPPDASPEARAAIAARAQGVLAQARAGADFAQLATQYTEEPGAAERGGDLGYFGPTEMVEPFSVAAFRLNTGEISDLVETPFGIHIIKVEDKRLPEFEPMKEQFRQQMVAQRVAEAEETYLTQLSESRQLEVQDGAVDVARDLARNPTSQLNRRQAERPLVRYTDGALTAGEYLTLMQQRGADQRSAVSTANEDQLADWLRLLARDEILVDEARRRGITIPQEDHDSARAELQRQLRGAAADAGLLATGDDEQAQQQQVIALLNGIVSGERNVVQVGAASFVLRQKYGAEIFDRAFPIVVERVQQQRPAMPALPEGMQLPPVPPNNGN